MEPEIREIVWRHPKTKGAAAETFIYEPSTMEEMNLGRLLLLLYAAGPLADVRSLFHRLASLFRRSYYHLPRREAHQAFEATLAEANTLISDGLRNQKERPLWGSLSLLLLGVIEEEAQFAKLGGAELFLLRNEVLSRLTKPALTKRAALPVRQAGAPPIQFSMLASGKVLPGDIFVALAPTASEYLSREWLRRLLLEKGVEGASERIGRTIEEHGVEGATAIILFGLGKLPILEEPPKKKEALPPHALTLEEIIGAAPPEPSRSETPWPRLRLPSLPRLPKLRLPALPKQLPRVFPLLLGALLLGAILIGTVVLTKEKREAARAAALEKGLSETETLVKQAEEAIGFRQKERAEKLLEEGQGRARGLLGTFRKETRLLSLEQDIRLKLSIVRGKLLASDLTFLQDAAPALKDQNPVSGSASRLLPAKRPPLFIRIPPARQPSKNFSPLPFPPQRLDQPLPDASASLKKISSSAKNRSRSQTKKARRDSLCLPPESNRCSISGSTAFLPSTPFGSPKTAMPFTL
ncbi:hypothetical protein HYW30_01930 [Candidatus Azambacteria bacterium]|nr:hypothetical protein [Candidatus Azambacteria bacterium]